MARWKTPRGKKKEQGPRGGLYGCILVIVMLIAFMTWTFFAVLNQN